MMKLEPKERKADPQSTPHIGLINDDAMMQSEISPVFFH
jgi:hypothetical protein